MDVIILVCEYFKGKLIFNMSYIGEEVEKVIEFGLVDVVVFGVFFIVNLDFLECLKCGVEFNEVDFLIFYIQGVEGYIDYFYFEELVEV